MTLREDVAKALAVEFGCEPGVVPDDVYRVADLVLSTVRDRLLSDESVEAASRDYEPWTWGPNSTRVLEGDALRDARSALAAAWATIDGSFDAKEKT